eukprot:Ihof_evm2s78 gene=Ihof_evmTU2s78
MVMEEEWDYNIMEPEKNIGLLAYVILHSRFMRLSSANISTALAMSNNSRVDKENKECETCSLSKAKRIPYPDKIDRATKVLQRVYSDLTGPLTQSYSGYRYVVTFTNEYSHYVQVHLLQKEFNTFAAFKRYHAYATAMHDKPMGTLVANNRTEYLNSMFSTYLEKFGIHHQTTVPRHSKQNGLKERMNQTLFTTIKSAHIEGCLPQYFWDKAIKSSEFILNVCQTE